MKLGPLLLFFLQGSPAQAATGRSIGDGGIQGVVDGGRSVTEVVRGGQNVNAQVVRLWDFRRQRRR
jgi:hypothetical protein